MATFHQKADCVLCGSRELEQVLTLGAMPIATPNFRVVDGSVRQDAERAAPLNLMLCQSCGQLQVGHVGDPDIQYPNYVYRTSLSAGLREHFKGLADTVLQLRSNLTSPRVLEIGSNDGTLLRFFQERGCVVAGIDPAHAIAMEATASGIPTTAAFFGEALAKDLCDKTGPVDLIMANNVIANIEDMADFSRGIAAILAPDGLFTFETQYGPDVIDGALLDTIYHEHISYFMIRPLAGHFLAHGLRIVDVEHIDTKGGSVRVFVEHAKTPASARVAAWIAEEERRGMFVAAFFSPLNGRVAEIRKGLSAVVSDAHAAGRAVAGYGVSVGTSTLLNQFGLSRAIAFLADDDLAKEAHLAGPDYRIPVRPPSALIDEMPAAVIIFAWRYADAIIARHGEYLARGGRFVIPLPTMRTISRQ